MTYKEALEQMADVKLNLVYGEGRYTSPLPMTGSEWLEEWSHGNDSSINEEAIISDGHIFSAATREVVYRKAE